MFDVICIRSVYSDDTSYDNYPIPEERFRYPVQKLFTEGSVYKVYSTKRNEWRTKDDTCSEEIPYNHIISGDMKWFNRHFKLLT